MTRSVGVLATARSDGRVVGHACFVARADGCADVAVAVLDGWQRQGIGTLLLARLMVRAREYGVRTLTATLDARNHGLVDALLAAGVALDVRGDGDRLHIEMPVLGPAEPAVVGSPRADAGFPQRPSAAAADGAPHAG